MPPPRGTHGPPRRYGSTLPVCRRRSPGACGRCWGRRRAARRSAGCQAEGHAAQDVEFAVGEADAGAVPVGGVLVDRVHMRGQHPQRGQLVVGERLRVPAQELEDPGAVRRGGQGEGRDALEGAEALRVDRQVHQLAHGHEVGHLRDLGAGVQLCDPQALQVLVAPAPVPVQRTVLTSHVPPVVERRLLLVDVDPGRDVQLREAGAVAGDEALQAEQQGLRGHAGRGIPPGLLQDVRHTPQMGLGCRSG